MDGIQVYGVFFTPEEEKERATWHDETWIEREIPKAIEEEIDKLIDEKIKEFEAHCQCGLCKLHNKE